MKGTIRDFLKRSNGPKYKVCVCVWGGGGGGGVIILMVRSNVCCYCITGR